MEIASVAALFPRMSPDEFAALKADIEANGQREPIWTHGGKIVDGRHRYQACSELGIKPTTREWDGDGSLTLFVVSLNLHRRSLTSSQRGAIAVEVEELLAFEAKERQRAAGGDKKSAKAKSVRQKVAEPIKQDDGKATEQAAKATGTNRQYVQDAKTLKAKSPELFEQVKAGTKKITQAKLELRKQEKSKDLDERAAAILEFETGQPPWTLINQDVMDGLQFVLENHAKPRLVFADPPYNVGVDYGNGPKADKLTDAKYMEWAADWIARCHELLTDDGSLWLMINDEYAAEYGVAIKRAGFTLRSWIKWYETFGVNCSNNFNRTSRHIFYAVKNPKRFCFNADAVMRPSDRQTKYADKRAAEGGKIWDDVWEIPRLTGNCDERMPGFPTQLPLALVEPIVLCASDPGDLVLDPFNGSGTTGEAAIRNKREYVGIDRSKQFIDVAGKRLATGGMRHAV